jgi:hypothetical protein
VENIPIVSHNNPELEVAHKRSGRSFEKSQAPGSLVPASCVVESAEVQEKLHEVIMNEGVDVWPIKVQIKTVGTRREGITSTRGCQRKRARARAGL